jgi:uncharacterized protein YprB with RNaseH-like and TPR domain
MRINLARLKRDELIYMATHRCEHRHLFIEHPDCYTPIPQRFAFFDIETTGFDAGFGIMLSYAIKVGGKDKIISDIITEEDIRRGKAGDEDSRLVRQCVSDLSKFDVIVTHYGNDYRFDVPFLRTRAVALDLPFPIYGTLKALDTYPILKSKFKLPRNRLETACRILLGSTEKTHLDPVIWRKAGRGDKKSLAYVLDHNIKDAKDLEKVYNKIQAYVRGIPKSI